jgi:protein subunit release factor B
MTAMNISKLPLQQDIRVRMHYLNVSEKDVEESFIRASGPGGQNVNKVASCVRLYHRPTGIAVRCQKERAQARNRALAWTLLLDKIEERRESLRRRQIQDKEKIRRQKRRRSKKAKEKMLARKKYRARIKEGRKRVQTDD